MSKKSAESGILYKPEFAIMCGDPLAGIMLSQIYYWYRPGDDGLPKLRVPSSDGYFWIAKSVKGWAKELGFTEKQARRCIELLKGKGFVVTRTMRFSGTPQHHLKLTFIGKGQHMLSGPEEIISMGAVIPLICPTGQVDLPIEASQDALQGKFNTETTQKSKTENTLPKLTLGQGQTMKASEILQGKSLAGQKGKSGLPFFWKNRIALLTDKFVKPLTQEEVGKLGAIWKEIGDDVYLALGWAMDNWTKYQEKVKLEKGVLWFTDLPEIPYFRKYYDVALDGYHKEKSKKNKQTVIQSTTPDASGGISPTKIAGKSTETPTVLATTEDLQELMAEIDAIHKAQAKP